jgi:hypothetical protein
MSKPPGELMGCGRRVLRLPDRGNGKTEGRINGEPTVSQTRKGPILGFGASRIVAVRYALSLEQWDFLFWLSSLERGLTA